MMKKRKNISMNIEADWKSKNAAYLNELQKFLDKAANIENEELREELICQMLRCDKVLTEMAEKKFQEYYEQEKND